MKKKIIKVKIGQKKIRGDWGQVKPFTRIEEDKTKFNRKEKHKVNIEE